MLKTEFYSAYASGDFFEDYAQKAAEAHDLLHDRAGMYAARTGWLCPAQNISDRLLDKIFRAADFIKKNCDIFVVLGAGGSYLGGRAAVEALTSQSRNLFEDKKPKILFAGSGLCKNALDDLLALCEGRDVCINVISKSGETMEPMLAFEILRRRLELRHGKTEAERRIFYTTGSTGKLREYAENSGSVTFDIPEDIGGRYSVLTPVGLLPMAVAGIDIKAVLAGASQAAEKFSAREITLNDCYKYACARREFYARGLTVEIFAVFDTRLDVFCSWLIQLFAESEGKEGKGILPTKAVFTADLHSLGQYIQQGTRNFFETILAPDFSPRHTAPKDDPVARYMSGELESAAVRGTIKAHTQGGADTLLFTHSKIDEETFGFVVYFFMKAAAVSAILMQVNPFDQPGVEEYKKNIRELLS